MIKELLKIKINVKLLQEIHSFFATFSVELYHFVHFYWVDEKMLYAYNFSKFKEACLDCYFLAGTMLKEFNKNVLHGITNLNISVQLWL